MHRSFVEAHDSGKECLEMNDCLGSIFAPVIKDNCVSQNFWLDVLGNPTSHFLATLSWLEEFSGQHLENHICCYSFGKQVIELRTNGSQLFWTLLRDHVFCDFSGVALILRTRHIRLRTEVWVFEFHCLKHHDGPTKVSTRLS